jgi:hypothetical protein
MLSIFEDLFSGNFRHFRGDQYSSPSNLTRYGRNFSICFPYLKTSFREIFAIFGAINTPPFPTLPGMDWLSFISVMRLPMSLFNE